MWRANNYLLKVCTFLNPLLIDSAIKLFQAEYLRVGLENKKRRVLGGFQHHHVIVDSDTQFPWYAPAPSIR